MKLAESKESDKDNDNENVNDSNDPDLGQLALARTALCPGHLTRVIRFLVWVLSSAAIKSDEGRTKRERPVKIIGVGPEPRA
jgi:hypothetical protein